MLELGQPIHGYDERQAARSDRRTPRPARARQLTTLDGVGARRSTRGPAHHRRLRPDRPGRRDGRRRHRDVGRRPPTSSSRRPTSTRSRSSAPRAGTSCPTRGLQALRARHRPDHPAGRGATGWPSCWSSTAAARLDAGRHRWSARRRRARPIEIDAELPAPDRRLRDRRRRPSREPARGRLRGRRRRRPDVAVTPPPWRPTSPTPTTWSRRCVRIVGYDQVPCVLPPAAAGRGLTRGQRLRRRVGRTRWPARGYVEVITFPFIGDRDLDALGLPADDPRRTVLRIANPLSEEEPAHDDDAAARPAQAVARNVGRGSTDLALFEIGTVFLPRRHGRPGADLRRRPAPDRRASSTPSTRRCPTSPAPRASCSPVTRERAGWWGRAARRPGPTRSTRSGAARRRSGVERRRPRRPATRPGTPAAAPRSWSATSCSGTRASCTRRVCTAYGVPARTAAAEIDLDAGSWSTP